MSEGKVIKKYLKPGENAVCGELLQKAQPGAINIQAVYCQNYKPCPLHTEGVKEPGAEIKKEICGKCKKEKAVKGAATQAGEVCDCGRPTKYTPELLAACRAYLEIKMPNKDTDEVIHSIEGLCDYPGVDISTVTAYEWVKDPEKEEFSNIVLQVMRKQGKRLVNSGLSETFSGRIVTLMLAKHGYRNAVDNFTREVPVDPAAQAAGDAAIDEYLGKK